MRGRPTGYWAKLAMDDHSGDVTSWLPLADHMIDVAACFRRLLGAGRDNVLAASAGLRCLTPKQKSRLCVMAYLHDLGKLNVGFQARAFPHEKAPSPFKGHVLEACALIGNPRLCQTFKESMNLERLANWFCSEDEPDDMVLCRMLLASWGHHGRAAPMTFWNIPAFESDFEQTKWDGWKYADLKDELLSISRQIGALWPEAFEEGDPIPCTAAFMDEFNGLLTLADWIGSDERHFVYEHGAEWRSRADFSLHTADVLIRSMGLDGKFEEPAGFEETFGFAPNSMQSNLGAPLVMPSMGRGTLRILEAETGSGKTEAAVGLYLKMRREGLVQNLYFALPTRTSAVQIHGRVVAAMRRALKNPPPVLLAVPGYARVDEEEGKLVHHRVLWDDESMILAGWAAENSKRYLAAAVAVGTIDQLLMSVLNVKHGSMRWASAARSLLAIDEVHASDPYMSVLLQEVIRRHVDRGGHVLIMSATLGSRMASRYLRAAGAEDVLLPALEDAIATQYPLIRTVENDRTVNRIPCSSQGNQKTIRLEPLEIIADPAKIAALAAEHVRAGAKTLIIRNTVLGCVAVHQELEKLLGPSQMMRVGPGGVTAPHHGRYAPEDRRTLDIAVEDAFGKRSPSRGIVLCATQTVEQSLDIDADIIITDLCPIDVLLQRIGRLHRHPVLDEHPKRRPAGYEVPRAIVLTPSHSTAEYIEKAGDGIGMGRAYSDVRTIEATRRLVVEWQEFKIPRDNRALVEMATHPEALERLTEVDSRFGSHGLEVEGIEIADGTFAQFNVRNREWRYGDDLLPRAEGRVTSRLGEMDAVIEFSDPPVGPFGLRIHSVRIPSWLIGSKAVELGNVRILSENLFEGFEFELGSTRYFYGRHGLERRSANGFELPAG